MTLTEKLKELGYTHYKSLVEGKQDVFKDNTFVGCYTASQAWQTIKDGEL